MPAQDINPVAYMPEFAWPNFVPRPRFEPITSHYIDIYSLFLNIQYGNI